MQLFLKYMVFNVVMAFHFCYAIIRGQPQERLPDRANGVQAVHVYLEK